MSKNEKITAENFFFFSSKIAINLSLGLQRDVQASGGSLQPWKENIQHSKHEISLLLSIFAGSSWPESIRILSPSLIIFFMKKFSTFCDFKSDQDPDPHWDKKMAPDPDPHWNQCGSTTLLESLPSMSWGYCLYYVLWCRSAGLWPEDGGAEGREQHLAEDGRGHHAGGGHQEAGEGAAVETEEAR